MSRFEKEAVACLVSAVIIGMFGHNVIEFGVHMILMMGPAL